MINGEICEKRWMYSQHLFHNIRNTLVINIFLLMTYVHVPISFPFTLFSTRRCYYFRGYDIRTKRYMRTFLKVIKTPSTTTYIKKQRKLWSWKIMTPCRLTNAPFLCGKNRRVASSYPYIVPTWTQNISVAKATPLEKACLYVPKSRCIVLAAEEGRTGHGTRSAVNYNNYKVATRKRRLTLN